MLIKDLPKLTMFLTLFIINISSNATDLDLSKEISIARNHVLNNLQELGVSYADINNAQVQSSHRSKHNGVTHIYMRQYVNGIEMHNGDMQIHLDKNGKVFLLHNQFEPNLANKVSTTNPSITANVAIINAFRHLEIRSESTLTKIKDENTTNKSSVFAKTANVLADIPAKLVVALNDKKQSKLAWDLQIQLANAWWNIRVDAATGEIVSKDNWTVNDNYKVFPIPYESPIAPGASHQVISNVADAIASPFGWHDTDGVAGAEFTDTQGNNVIAQEDQNANNGTGFKPDGGAILDFDFTYDPAAEPDAGENLEVGIVNLFYMNNIIHDVMYQYGFDEASGNFQTNSYGNGGSGNDPVNADAQDGGGINNANFGTPPDGTPPRMQMFNWTAPTNFIVNSPASIANNYPAIVTSDFGTILDATGVTGNVELANDNTGTARDACEPLVGFTAGKIALIERGTCAFVVKVANAQTAGATAAIVFNDEARGDAILSMGGTDASITIPSVFIGHTSGITIVSEINNNVNVIMNQPIALRDGDLDNGIIVHEYGHGISNRLTGGRFAASCLENEEQMGEGWSDFFALVMTAQAGDQATDARAMGIFAVGSPSGIRQYPYSTDMTVNLHTFTDLGTPEVSVPHGVGSIWAQMLWEVYWNLVTTHGYDADIYNGTGGNNIALQLVMDGLKLQPCSPGFINGRDAIIAADIANNAGANKCDIWKGFAKRGLGLNALSGNNDVLGDETQDFTYPAECDINPDVLFKNGFEFIL